MENNKTNSPKEKLEIEKLQTEIKDIKRRIIPQWIASFGPWFIGLLTIFLAYRSGFIDNKATLNEIKAAKVEAQVKEFEDRRDSLSHVNDSLFNFSGKLKFENSSLRGDSQRLNVAFEKMKNDELNASGKIAQLVIKVDDLSNNKQNLESQINFLDLNLKKKIDDTSRFYESQATRQLYRHGNDMDRLVTRIQNLNYDLGECEILRKRAESELENLKKQINVQNK